MTLEQWKSVAGLAESLAKIVALGVGGAWTYLLFVKNRTGLPRAEVAHTCTAYPIDGDHAMLRVTLTVKNKSNVLLQITAGRIAVQQIAPFAGATEELEPGFAGTGDSFEYAWPLIGDRMLEYSDDRYLEVEPGESEAIDFDVFIAADVKVVQIYSYLKNVSKKSREIGWNCTSIHQLVSRGKAEGAFE
jgi:hypothetical protein